MRYRLEIVVFISGAAVMMLEIVASRILAPYFGTSTFVWTSLIGVILASLSAGYYWGGQLADRRPESALLAKLLLLSSLLVISAVGLNFILLSMVQKLALDLRLAAVISASILFGPASVVLGMVSPFAARLRMDQVSNSGSTIGRLYALSTLGSIVGTFAAGFWLIAIFGSVTLLLLIAALLLLPSLIMASSADHKKIAAALIIIMGLIFVYRDYSAYAKTLGFIDVDTNYSRVWIYESKEHGRTLRNLMFDPFGVQSGIYEDDPNETIDGMKYPRLAKVFSPEAKSILVIGGAAYTGPRDLLTQFPDAVIDVVEIDPALTDLAKRYFYLTDSPRLKIHHEDGRTFLNRNTGQYDILIVDAFNSSSSIPFQLVTKEAFQLYRSHLNPRGTLVVNSVGRFSGPGHEFFSALHKTISEEFKNIEIFPWTDSSALTLRQNMILVALPEPFAEPPGLGDSGLEKLLSRRFRGTVNDDAGVFTDNFAPAELYVAQMINGALR